MSLFCMCYAECRCAESHYCECCYAEHRCAEQHYANCRYAERHYVDCFGAFHEPNNTNLFEFFSC